ncbi:FkbM family methyltransferase [Sphingomonas sp. BIUV-7]|uniref:FkbM family methyltransferase n=1 Tax=Sphingomonas natans TaxID=3063330 RepID=A0ABT8Y5Q8_9SPHN|nr:FkbM family methyltransferase [Sphingomonas sp. BIUV-7]MDO6413658.1 FkbM family methyltransferase [Sphingomonas sp. BIUV-7]
MTAAIELILGRTPEPALVQYHVEMGFSDRAALGRYLMSTDEFQRLNRGEPVDLSSWEGRAAAGRDRRRQLASFGPNAFGLVVEAKRGLFVVDPEDSAVTGALLQTGEYGEDELALAATFIQPDSNVLVVGTHIGSLAVPLSKLCSSLDAVEANPSTQRLAEANLRVNACWNVTLHKVAAGETRGQIPFLINRENSGGSKRKPLVDRDFYLYDDPEQVMVDCFPLDEICGGKSYDLIIMDIEGSEFFALKGMPRILSKAQALSVEFLPHHIRDVAGVPIDAFVDQIEPHFAWLYVPDRNEVFSAGGMRDELRQMYEQGISSAGLYFLKDCTDKWRAQVGARLK